MVSTYSVQKIIALLEIYVCIVAKVFSGYHYSGLTHLNIMDLNNNIYENVLGKYFLKYFSLFLYQNAPFMWILV